MAARFIGNVKNKTLHITSFADGRCHLNQIRPEQKIEFDTLEDAMKYPGNRGPIFHKCGVCFPKMENTRQRIS